MTVIKAIVMVTLVALVDISLARGDVTTLAQQREVLTEGLAKVMATRFKQPRRLAKLGEIIYQQKQAFILRMDDKDLKFYVEVYAHKLRESNAKFAELMNKEVMGELTDEDMLPLRIQRWRRCWATFTAIIPRSTSGTFFRIRGQITPCKWTDWKL